MILAVLATIRAAQKHLSAAACQRLKAQKRGKVFTWPVFACLGITRVENKRNSLKRKPKMAAKCESQASRGILLGLVTLGSGSLLLTGQQPTPPSVFTSAQAEAGRHAYENTCGKCHTYGL